MLRCTSVPEASGTRAEIGKRLLGEGAQNGCSKQRERRLGQAVHAQIPRKSMIVVRLAGIEPTTLGFGGQA